MLSTPWETNPGSQDVWIGCGNRAANRWDWQSGDSCLMADTAPYVDAQHSLLIAVVLSGTDAHSLRRIEYRLPPVPVIATDPDPPESASPLNIVFDASGSIATNGPVEKYEWDFDCDGIYDFTSTVSPLAVHFYEYPTEHMVYLRITDSLGASATGSVKIKAMGTMLIELIPRASEELGSDYPSLCMVEGHPAISYYNWDEGSLMYMRSVNPYGSSWPEPVLVDGHPGEDTGMHGSMQVVGGRPAIAHCTADTPAELRYVRALDSTGSAWDVPVTVAVNSAGYYAALQVVSGRPAIAYHETDTFSLMYVRALDADGTAWAEPVQVIGGGYAGEYLSLAVIDGRPAISYWDKLPQDACYVRALGADGNAWGTPVTLDGPDNVGSDTCLAMLPGGPAVSYFDLTNNALKFTAATDAAGGSWTPPLALDDRFRYGYHSSIVMIDGLPVIFYRDYMGDVLVIRATDADGSVWLAPETLVDEPGKGAGYSESAVIELSSGIAAAYCYCNRLKFVREIR